MTDPQATPPDASATALEAHRPYLLTLARAGLPAALSRRVDPSDVVQQTLLRACRGLEGFRGTTEAERAAWLRQILRNTLIDALREHGGPTRDARLERSLDATLAASDAALDRLAASSVGGGVVRREAVGRLAAALAELPEDQRRAVERHHLDGLGVAAVAAEMARTPAAVAGLLRRGLKALRTALSDDTPPR